MRSDFIASIAGLLGVVTAAPAPATEPTPKQIYQFPNLTFIENVALRSNGHLLLNTFDRARIYDIDPNAENPEPSVVAQIPDSNQLTGIVEVAPDVFAVSSGVEGPPFGWQNGTAKVSLVSLNGCREGGAADVKTVARIPQAQLLNGMAGLPTKPHVVLSIESAGGRIFRTDTLTGAVDVAFQDDKLSTGTDSQLVPLGANGLNIYDGYLYFGNSNQQFFGRIKISEDGDRLGDVEELYMLPSGDTHAFDDFDITSDGVSYVTLQGDSIGRLTPDGELEILIGPESDVKLFQPTSLNLSEDEKTVYIVTGGNDSEGGQVVVYN